MELIISQAHKQQLKEIGRSLHDLGNKEANFLKVESLFFDAIYISRQYGNDFNSNPLLYELVLLQQDQYAKTKIPTRKSSQREVQIRQFMVKLKKVLASC